MERDDIERSSDLAAFPSAVSYEQLITAYRRLLAEAEQEVGRKERQDPEKSGAEFWAAQKLPNPIPGVERRIKLARAVLESRRLLASLPG